MGSSLPKFGQIDLELDGEPGAKPARRATPSFGELDLASIGAALEELDVAPEGPPSPPTRAPVRETPTRQSLEAVRLAEEETRIAQAGVVEVALSRACDPIDAEAATRIGVFDDVPPSSSSSRRNAPSASGVASRDDRVAAMRELYAQGDAEAALALASELSFGLEAGLELDLEVSEPGGGLIPVDEDPFGGLELVEDEDAQEHTAIIEASADSSRLATMTSRAVPRLLVDLKEISRLPMDPRAAFILGHIDGIQSMEEILDVCAMPEADALELIERLCRMGVVSLR